MRRSQKNNYYCGFKQPLPDHYDRYGTYYECNKNNKVNRYGRYGDNYSYPLKGLDLLENIEKYFDVEQIGINNFFGVMDLLYEKLNQEDKNKIDELKKLQGQKKEKKIEDLSGHVDDHKYKGETDFDVESLPDSSESDTIVVTEESEFTKYNIYAKEKIRSCIRQIGNYFIFQMLFLTLVEYFTEFLRVEGEDKTIKLNLDNEFEIIEKSNKKLFFNTLKNFYDKDFYINSLNTAMYKLFESTNSRCFIVFANNYNLIILLDIIYDYFIERNILYSSLNLKSILKGNNITIEIDEDSIKKNIFNTLRKDLDFFTYVPVNIDSNILQTISNVFIKNVGGTQDEGYYFLEEPKKFTKSEMENKYGDAMMQ